MVRRKTTRQLAKSKPKKPDVSILDDDDEERKENLQKRLDDFDMQVKEITQNMESDKQSVIDSIKHLYFVDEQRTPSLVNNMPWIQFLKQNTPYPESVIRKSIAELINKAEDSTLCAKTTKRKKRGANCGETPTVLTETTRATRSRASKINTEASALETSACASSIKPKRGRQPKDFVQSTPLNANSLPLSSLLITPKFDPRTPLPMNTLRKPKLGEIAVSLKGSPLQVAPQNSVDDFLSSDLSDVSREQLQGLKRKLSQLLKA